MKRMMLMGVLALATLLVAAACSSDDPTATPTKAPAAAAAPQATATPTAVVVKRKELLSLAAPWNLPFSGHPADNRFNTTHFTQLHQLPVFGVDPWEEGLDTNYGATTSYKLLPGAKGIVMKIRQGLTFHSGDPITAEDVAFSFALSASEFAEAQISGGLNKVGLQNITVIDKETVRIDFEGALVTFHIEYSPMVNPVYVVNKSAHSNGDMSQAAFDAYRAAPDGFGAYKFAEGMAQEFIALEAVDGKNALFGEALYDRIEFRNIKETGTRVAQLRAGEQDLVAIGRDQISVVEGAGAKIGSKPSANMIGLYFFQTFLEGTSTAKMEVRQAIAHSIDSELIGDTIFGGVGIKKWGCTWPPDAEIAGVVNPAYLEACDTPYAYDPEKSKALLKAAGVAPGELSVNLVFWGNYPEEAQLAEAMQPMIEAVGINAKVERIDRAEWSKRRADETLMDSVLFFGPGGRVSSVSGSGSVYGPKLHLGPRQDEETMAAYDKMTKTSTMEEYGVAVAAFSKLIYDKAYGPGFFAAASIWAIGEGTPEWGLERTNSRGPLNLLSLVTGLNP